MAQSFPSQDQDGARYVSVKDAVMYGSANFTLDPFGCIGRPSTAMTDQRRLSISLDFHMPAIYVSFGIRVWKSLAIPEKAISLSDKYVNRVLE
jgi:hypothetical protein